MVPYLGDFAEDATVYIPFNTFDSNDPSASVTITNLADADIKVHKDGSGREVTISSGLRERLSMARRLTLLLHPSQFRTVIQRVHCDPRQRAGRLMSRLVVLRVLTGAMLKTRVLL
jgi:hypothetical protein